MAKCLGSAFHAHGAASGLIGVCASAFDLDAFAAPPQVTTQGALALQTAVLLLRPGRLRRGRRIAGRARHRAFGTCTLWHSDAL